ncbi:hypothetical protein PAXINDRAFT_76464 [Paxillus involutus ATCC 200175]|uniref:Uncharacterized protein n=1 Tax=Paxillus involutus ATCC 200175 TaxID=664439 RepID=A0A0C9UA20_PAXIN|nr:hypothetical protein PAXINDRAFT_76464 [Paxillus involutus ATCC 200175]
MSILNADILHILISELPRERGNVSSTLLNLASASHHFREACLPFLFAEVRWPHKSKADKEHGLLFYPEALWPYIRSADFLVSFSLHFRLDWHDEWTEPGRVRYGYMDREGIYCPYHLELAIYAITRMPKLNKVTLSTPFLPPQALYEALGQCRSLNAFTLIDTPIDQTLMQLYPAPLRQVNLTPVGQTLRIGDGQTDPKFAEITYFMRDWRRKYRAQANLRGLREIRSTAVFLREHAPTLTHLELSGDLCSLTALTAIDWPNLSTFVLHGHAPNAQTILSFHMGPTSAVNLFDVLDKMPVLQDLRLLFPRTKSQDFVFVDPYVPPHPDISNKLACLTSFAISNACKLHGIFNYMTNLERLAILAMVDLPRWPIALSQAEVERVLADIGASNCELKHLRLIIEDKLTPAICSLISAHCPHLEVLEIERCGYHDGKSMSTCQEFLDALSPLCSLRDLRICMQFPEYDEVDDFESWRVVREECAALFARGLKTLKKVGFEYRKRTGTHRYQDAWLDYVICRGGEGEGRLRQLPGMWYAFPEVWVPTRLPF